MKRWKAWAPLFILGTATAVITHAEMPSTQRTKYEQSFTFGDIRIRQSLDSMKDPMSPEFTMQVLGNKHLGFQLNDAAFDSFHAAPTVRHSSDCPIPVGLPPQPILSTGEVPSSSWPTMAPAISVTAGRLRQCARSGTTVRIPESGFHPMI